MNKTKIEKLVVHCIKEYFDTESINEQISKNTPLFGNNSVLDSIGLVNVIIDIESRFLDEDVEISLTSEKAMSRRNSPFRTITTLADFIEEQISEKEKNDE